MAPEKISIRDEHSGATAEILAGFGFNLFSYRPVVLETPVQVLWSAPGFEMGTERPSHSGIPILFPFPGRLRGKSFSFDGKSYSIRSTPDDGRGNAIHGYVLNRPWRVVELAADRAVGEFHAGTMAPELLNEWPSDFLIRVRYQLSANKLLCDIEVANPSDRPLPFGLGTHAYFRVPLGASGDPADCRVTVPAAEYWELADMLPTGERLEAEGPKGVAHGLTFAETKLDDAFTGLSYTGGKCTARIVDPHHMRVLSITFDSTFRECVVYNPPHREAICIEPYTCVPDAYTLAAEGVDTGLRVLSAGQSIRCRIEMGVTPA